ncbi:hypothetical protein [Serratia symbiotica]|uniref:Uncharacterized protein n=1 Tax=Serratia symbiotica SCt-VLC TaxID=1347341 RepID=A0A068RBJ1_9GAMM|nr:hypothetical protein [Serratia symbiotica]CDG48410.1 hypothetical protein SCTVLC_1715 [Serratia symbiotica SCt-VLC]
MNFTGNEVLSAAIAALSNDMCDLHLRLRGLVSRYYWNSDVLAERLAGHILRDAHDRYVEIYKTINELEHYFKD